MFGIINYEMYVTSCIILSLIPGTDTMFILGQSISNDRKTGLFSVLGMGTGILVHTTFVSLGLSVLLKNSPMAFNIVKALGAAYLIYMGIKTVKSKNSVLADNLETAKGTFKKAYFQGMITNVLNPKVALFFLAFLPQFVNPEHNYGAFSFILLGLTSFICSTLWGVVLSLFASAMAGFLKKRKGFSNAVNKISGSIFILLGLNLLRAKLV